MHHTLYLSHAIFVIQAWWNACHGVLHVATQVCRPLTRLLWALNHVIKAGLRKHIQCHDVPCWRPMMGQWRKDSHSLVLFWLFWVWAVSSRSSPTLHQRCPAPAVEAMDSQSLNSNDSAPSQRDSALAGALGTTSAWRALDRCWLPLSFAGNEGRIDGYQILGWLQWIERKLRVSPSVHQHISWFLTSEIPAAESDLSDSDFDFHVQIHISKAFIHQFNRIYLIFKFLALNVFSSALFAVPLTFQFNDLSSI